MRNVLITAKKIKKSQLNSKVEFDGFMTRFLFRPCSYYFASFLYIKLRLKPNFISILSGLLGLLALIVAYFSQNLVIISLFLFSIACLDNADGALARYLKLNNQLGSAADAIGGYIIMFTSPLLCLIMLNKSGYYEQYNFLIVNITFFVISLEFLGRTMNLKLSIAKKEKDFIRPSLTKRITGNLSFCGFMFPFYILSWILNLQILAWLYAISFSFLIGIFGFLSSILYLLKNSQENHNSF